MPDAEKTKQELIRWIADYFKNNAADETKAVVGISGGKDSAVVAALCAEALGKERVLGVLMPCGEQSDIDVARDTCETLGIHHFEINIGETARSLFDLLEDSGIRLNEAARVNTPARLRMATLYAVSAAVGGRVANTCNLSEDWVGYSTKFGDSAGDFSPLSKLTVTEVKAVGKALGLPERFTHKLPIDGLSGKSDEENLGFSYEVLDRYIREKTCEDTEVKEKIDRLRRINMHKLLPMPVFSPYKNSADH
ncbi:MAG: NAD(+) synthase [Oscillospiraceae bacterium]|nr:NAD(+) synthase [Oscillospiraceae bacterium]